MKAPKDWKTNVLKVGCDVEWTSARSLDTAKRLVFDGYEKSWQWSAGSPVVQGLLRGLYWKWSTKRWKLGRTLNGVTSNG